MTYGSLEVSISLPVWWLIGLGKIQENLLSSPLVQKLYGHEVEIYELFPERMGCFYGADICIALLAAFLPDNKKSHGE